MQIIVSLLSQPFLNSLNYSFIRNIFVLNQDLKIGIPYNVIQNLIE